MLGALDLGLLDRIKNKESGKTPVGIETDGQKPINTHGGEI